MSSFRCEDAPAHFGVRDAHVDDCAELLPGLFRVVLSGPSLPHPTIFRAAFADGAEVSARGLPAFAGWARAVALYATPALEPWPLGQALEVLHAFPPGFDAESVASVVDPATGRGGAVRRDPLTLTAYRMGWPPKDGEGESNDGDVEPTVARATLRGTSDYTFVWTVEVREPGGDWAPAPMQ